MAGIFLPGTSKGGDITAVTAGDGLSGGGDNGDLTVTLDLNELTAAVVAVASDSIAIIDADDDGSKKESVADFVSGIAGTNISAGSGQLSVADSAAGTKGIAIVAGTSPVSVSYSSGTATVSVTDSSTSAKGIASFSSDNFAASSGAITIKDNGVAIAEIADIARGSIIVGNASAATAALAIGSNNYVLTSDGTDIAWEAAASSATALDDIATGDGAASLVTTVGNITIDAQANDADVIIKVDDAGAAITAVTFDGSDEGNAIFANDILLNTDSAVIKMGVGADATLTHDGTTGLTVAANPFEVDSGGNIPLDAHTGIFIFQDANTEVLRITEGNSGDVTIKLETNAKDLIFTDNNDDAGLTVKDGAVGIVVPGEVMTTKISFTDGDDAITIADTGLVTFAQDISTTDGKWIKLGGSTMATAEPGASDSGYGIVIGLDSAGSITAGDAVCINSSGKATRANAATGSITEPCIGIATNDAGSDGDDCYVLTHGIWRHDAEAFDAGDPVYLGESAGVLTKTAPSDNGDYVQRVGVAVTDDVLLVMPDLAIVEIA